MISYHKRQITYCCRKGDLIMKRKQLWRVLGTGGLALSLFVSPMTGVSALAADDGTTGVTPQAGEAKGLNPLQKAKPAVGNEGDPDYKPAVDGYTDTQIPVYGFTQDSTVYSVDVEWGAMTFRYENSTWDPETHTSQDGAGWQVYDSVADEALEETEHTINEIKVTNHSNAGVWATLDYAGKQEGTTDYTGIKGAFTYTADKHENVATALTAAAADGSVPAYLTLGDANNGLGTGGAGKETVGKAYFMPTNPDTNKGETAPSNIEKWTQIGTITVGIKTAQPGTTTP